jgi:hypothetical protein
MKIDRRLTHGMFILGALGHYDNEEVIRYANIQYIAKTLKKKHFEIEKGTVQDRMWSKPNHVINQIKKNPKKKKQFIQKGERAFQAILDCQKSWIIHTKIANEAWMEVAKEFTDQNYITVTELILALLRKEPDTMKYYGFNEKKLEKFRQTGQHQGEYIFSSSRTASRLIKRLDETISHYHYNQSKKA